MNSRAVIYKSIVQSIESQSIESLTSQSELHISLYSGIYIQRYLGSCGWDHIPVKYAIISPLRRG